MNKLLVIVLALLTILCLVACDSADAPADTATPGNTEATTTKAPVTTDEPDDDDDGDDDDDTSNAGISYADQLNAIFAKAEKEDVQSAAIDVTASMGVDMIIDGATNQTTIPMSLSLVMNEKSEFYADVSASEMLGLDTNCTLVYVDGVVYRTDANGEMVKANASENDIEEMLGLEDMSFDMSDLSEEELAELPEEVADLLTDFKVADIFKDVKLTSNKNGVRVITCTGLSDKVVSAIRALEGMSTDGTPAGETSSMLGWFSGNAASFSLSFTVNANDQIVGCKMDMRMDMSDMTGDMEGVSKYEMTLSMNVTIDRSPDTSMVVAPANADEYTVVELEDMFDMSGGEEMPDGDIWGLTGTVTNVYDNGTADICYLTYDEYFNEYYETITVNVPDEWMDYLPFIVHIEADIELICHEDGTYTLSWISEGAPSSYTDWGTLLSVDTDADGYTYATVLINASGDDGPYVFLVPDGMIEEASSLVGSEVAVEVVLKDDGTYTLISIEPYSW